MFNLNEDEQYEAEINGIIFVCENVEDGFEETASKIAERYESKLSDIADFMLKEGISDCFGKLTLDDIRNSLGTPVIDLENELITYFDHSFDEEHIIELEFEGILDDFMYLNIDG